MLELLLYGLLAIAAAVGLFLVAARFLPAGEQIAPPVRDEAPWGLPGTRPLSSTDVDTVRLPVALRGYRFAETDELLDRLAGELRERDEEIARLRVRADVPIEQQPAAPDLHAPPADPAEVVAGPVEPAESLTKPTDPPAEH